MAKKKIKRNKRYFNTYDGGGLLGQFASWNEGATKNFMSSGVGGALGKLGVSGSGLGGIANGVASTVSGLINPSGNSTGVGNAMQAIGSVASNIPGIGGVIGAGVNLVGGLVNAAFGSNLNEEFIAETEDKTRQQANYVSDANDNASLMSDWRAYTDMAHVKKSDVGSDGWFSNKAKNKTKELNKAIDRANFRAWGSLANTAGNVDRNNDYLIMQNYHSFGGPVRKANHYDGGGFTDFMNSGIADNIGNMFQGLSTATGGYDQVLQNSLGRNNGSSYFGIASTLGMGTYDIMNTIRNLTKSKREPLAKKIGLYADGGNLGMGTEGGGVGIGSYAGIANSALKLAANAINEANNLEDTSSIEEAITQHGNTMFGGDNSSLMDQWASMNELDSNVSMRDIRDKSLFDDFLTSVPASFEGFNAGSSFGPWGAAIGGVVGGVSSVVGSIIGRNKAKDKAKELNKMIEEANARNIASFNNAVENNESNLNMNALSQFYKDGGSIHIKKKNRGKFTDYCGGKVTSECIARGKRSSSPTIRKRATFAANARKWKHEDGGPLDSLVSDINSRSKADFVQRLLDPNRAYIPDWESDRIATHKLSYATDDNGAIVFPNVQRIDGKLYDFTDPKNKRGKWDALDSAIERGDTLRMTPAQAEEFTKTYKRYYPKGKTFKAFGGPLFTHGGIWSNGITEINEGGTHEENPFEGVQMGVDPQGIPNLVEEGEVVYNDYVFSNRMKVPKDVKKKLKTRGNTFAEVAKELSKESEERPNDPISKNGLDAFMSALSESQEEMRMKNENRRNNRYAKGGKLGKRFEGLGPDSNWIDYGTLASHITSDQLERMMELGVDGSDIPLIGTSEDIDNAITRAAAKKGTTTGNKSNLSYLRYAPAIMSGISAFSDIFSKPDYSAADRVASIDIQPALVSADPIGQYLSYKPLDRLFYINQLNKNAAAIRRAINNNSGGNRAAALAGILAADASYGENLGKLARQAEEYNQALRERVAGFNRQTDMFNSQQSMQAQAANQASRNSATQMRLAQAERVAQLRQAAKDAYNARRSNNLNSFITNLGNIGWENYQREMINSNPALYYTLSGIGGVGYKGTTKKNGGKLKKKRRTTYA